MASNRIDAVEPTMLKKLIYTSLFAISFNALSIEQNEIKDIQQKANLGDSAAQLLLGQLLITNKIQSPGDQKQKGVELIFNAARAGNSKAQFMVGVLYEKGMVGEVDLDKAYIAYEDAASNGYAKSLVNMGYIKEKRGQLDEARALYTQAGQSGDSLGFYNLYLLEKAEENEKKAQKWLILAAQNGSDAAQYLYALQLVKQIDGQVLNDESTAIKWLKVAAKKGNPDAMTELASLLDNGSFTSNDLARLKPILNTLASRGDDEADFILAKLYMDNNKSYRLAWPLLERAISNDVDGALSYKKFLLDSMKQITTEKDLFISHASDVNNNPPVLIKQGSQLNVTEETHAGSVFVVADELGVYGLTERLNSISDKKVNDRKQAASTRIEIPQTQTSVSQSKSEPKVNVLDENKNIHKVIAVVNRPVNFRGIAHPESEILKTLSVGDEVEFISTDKFGWSKVVSENVTGFVMDRAIDYGEK
ncbi:tetratricopeptide repeat protein [Pseudoalteromonas sp. SK20]|uniref:tetratricopeptide repeat protein n=1 Tax=Pseudoalteromonas sp. SK20 TaxID=1938367 RepID=UPI000977157F|nr:tetratricopeptide repeat protein [Pseudoalteromonas sp. SK20]